MATIGDEDDRWWQSADVAVIGSNFDKWLVQSGSTWVACKSAVVGSKWNAERGKKKGDGGTTVVRLGHGIPISIGLSREIGDRMTMSNQNSAYFSQTI